LRRTREVRSAVRQPSASRVRSQPSMPDLLADPQTWASLLTLSALEIVLGIDNIVFISLMAGRLPRHRQARARQVGLVLALFSRLALLASIAWIVTLTRPLFEVAGLPV